MVKAVGGFLRALLGLVALVAAAYGGWKWGDAVFPRMERLIGLAAPQAGVGREAPSEALSNSALARVELFQKDGGPEMELSGAELTSLLRYTKPSALPSGVHDPTVVLEDGRARITAEVALADFPRLPDLGPVAGMLPDTVGLQFEGSIMGFGDRQAVLFVQGMEVAGVPLPRRLIPQVMTAVGRTDRPGLPREATTVPLPRGIASAYVVGDRLVLVADR